MHTSAPWHELVTAALLGSERRSPPGGSTTALLDAAATWTVRRRAGARPAVAAPRPETARRDPRPPLPAAAAERLTLLLAHRAGGASDHRRGSTPDLGELLPQWLTTANAYGYRAPHSLLAALLDAARARTDLRPQALAFGGPRALWLARLNPDWKFALRDSTVSSATGNPAAADRDQEETRRRWHEGLFAERVALLGTVRERDAAAGLALLEETWASERAEDRLMFLDTLRAELSAGDEPFLERALADRSRTVRTAAAELLSSLPRSALAARMARRARSCVGLDRSGEGGDAHGGERIAVEAPHECDTAMRRDGVTPKPPPERGERSWWLGQVLEAAPLEIWSERFGARTPSQIVALPVADGWRRDLHDAWCGAAVRQRDADWARALIGSASAPPADGPGDAAKLLTVLPAAERSDWAARFIATHGLSEAFRILGGCAVPWSADLGRAVVDALETARHAGSYPWSFSGVMGLAERCLDPREADRLDPLASDEETEGDPSGSGSYWMEAFQRLVATLRLRATMLEELAGSRLGGHGLDPEAGSEG